MLDRGAINLQTVVARMRLITGCSSVFQQASCDNMVLSIPNQVLAGRFHLVTLSLDSELFNCGVYFTGPKLFRPDPNSGAIASILNLYKFILGVGSNKRSDPKNFASWYNSAET